MQEFSLSIFPDISLKCNYSIGCLHLCKRRELVLGQPNSNTYKSKILSGQVAVLSVCAWFPLFPLRYCRRCRMERRWCATEELKPKLAWEDRGQCSPTSTLHKQGSCICSFPIPPLLLHMLKAIAFVRFSRLLTGALQVLLSSLWHSSLTVIDEAENSVYLECSLGFKWPNIVPEFN